MGGVLMNKNIVMALPRSGTVWLHQLMTHADNCYSCHEAKSGDVMLHGYYSDDLARREAFQWKVRLDEVDKKIDSYNYFEVNYRWVYHAPYFDEMDDIKILFWVRDGRDVVQSMVNHDQILTKDHWSSLIVPENQKIQDWIHKSQFEKACFLWGNANKTMYKTFGNGIKIEDANESFKYFKRNILRKTGIEIDRKYWERYSKKPVHVGNSGHSKWSKKQKDIFRKYCYDIQKEMGYESY